MNDNRTKSERRTAPRRKSDAETERRRARARELVMFAALMKITDVDPHSLETPGMGRLRAIARDALREVDDLDAVALAGTIPRPDIDHAGT